MARTAVGVVGYGNWGRNIVRDLIALGAAVTVVARDETKRRAALDAGAARVAGATDDLPDDLEGLVVATPTVTHAEVTEQLIPYGVPIYAEKPLTCDSAAARHLAELAPDRLFVMHKWRYHPGILGDEPWFALESSTAHPIRRREIKLVCRDGVAMVHDPYADHILVTRGEPNEGTRQEEKRPISTEFPLLRELRAFLEHLDGGPPPKSNAEEAVADAWSRRRCRLCRRRLLQHGSEGERREVIMAPRSGAGLRDGVGGTGLEPVTPSLSSRCRRSPLLAAARRTVQESHVATFSDAAGSPPFATATFQQPFQHPAEPCL